MNLHENFTTNISENKEELIKFWKSSACGSRSKNLKKKDFTTLQEEAIFHSLAHTCGKMIGSS